MNMAENSISPYQVRSYSEITPYRPITSRDHPQESANKPQFLINLKFSGNSRFNLFVINENSTQLGSTNIPLGEIRICFKLKQFLCQETAREAIAKELKHYWPLPGEHPKIIEAALRGTWRGVISMPASHNVLHLHFRVAIVQENYFEQRRVTSFDRVIGDSMDEEEVRMVPADEKSIENLERKEILSGSVDGDCAVCMEEFWRESEVVCMPCSHVFHGDCIKKWLRTSHYCPVCRFEMPT